MAGPIEYFMGFDAFSNGWFSWVYMTCFLVVFIYFGTRATVQKPFEKAIQVTAGSMFFALLVAFTTIPRFWSGLIFIVGYEISSYYVYRTDTRVYIRGIVSLILLLLIFSFIPSPFGYAFSGFALFVYYVLSEFDIRNAKKKAAAAADKQKK